MRCQAISSIVLFSVAALWSGFVPGSIKAQDDPPAAEKPANEPPPETTNTPADDPAPEGDQPAAEKEANPVEEWKTTNDRRWEIARELNQLKKDFADADTNGKRKIRSQFDNLLFEFQVEVLPRLRDLADPAFKADPTNRDAGEMVLRSAWDSNDIARSQSVVDQLLAAGDDSEYVLNTAGAIYCEMQDYARARDLLSTAEQNGKLEPVMGVRNLKIAKAYLAEAEGSVDKEAAELILEDSYTRNQYEKAVSIGEAQLSSGNDSENVLSYLGSAYFAVERFEEAAKLFKQAKDSQKINFRAQQIQPEVEKYLGLWEAEKKLREAESAAEGEDALPSVTLKTTRGDIEILLCENEAPNTVANFISLIDNKKYDGVAFHRVIPNFMVQGGDPNSLDDDPENDGIGGPGYTIACECYNENARSHFRGSLSMAHAGRDTGGSQFFITHCPTPHLNADPEAERGHTVFGYVVKGMDVVNSIRKGDRIESATVTRRRDHDYVPTTKPDAKQENDASEEDGKAAEGEKETDDSSDPE